MLNPPDRPPTTAPTYPNDVPRDAPEPPRFATKFLDEFSGKQTTLKSFFGGGAKKQEKKEDIKAETPVVPVTPGTEGASCMPQGVASTSNPRDDVSKAHVAISAPFNLARAAFDALDQPTIDDQPEASGSKRRRSTTSASIDLTAEDDMPMPSGSRSAFRPALEQTKKASKDNTKTKPNGSKKNGKATGASQSSISAFFGVPKQRSVSISSPPRETPEPRRHNSSPKNPSRPPSSRIPSSSTEPPDRASLTDNTPEPQPDSEQAEAIAAAVAAADAERAQEREAKKAQVAPIWNNLFAKKLPPVCTVHQKPCKDFIVKIPGPNKGKRFWLCSL